jgi:hypothetical protein
MCAIVIPALGFGRVFCRPRAVRRWCGVRC